MTSRNRVFAAALFAQIAFALTILLCASQVMAQYTYKSRPGLGYPSSGYSKTYLSKGHHTGSHSSVHSHRGHDNHVSHRYGRSHHRGHGFGGISVSVGGLQFGYGYPSYYSSPYGYYGSQYSYSSPYGVYYRPSEYYLPSYQPAELQYGLDRNFALELLRNRDLTTLPRLEGSALPKSLLKPTPVVQKRPRTSNSESLERGKRFIEYGDNLFKQQRIQEALGRYKSAESAAPDLAEAHFRKAIAYLATNRSDYALSSIKRGIFLDPGYVQSGFKIDDLYQNNTLAKSAMLDTLARRALDDPQNAEHMFLVGVVIYFDGQEQTAEKYFARAASLSPGADHSYIAAFMPSVANRPAAGQPAAAQPAAPVVGYEL
ncbi:MAG: hypothetical protein COA78_25380 [Blastopirellula sp.]|nr:MAG: hypothetical protein COA78_25380 [Blastopirellula sp.]